MKKIKGNLFCLLVDLCKQVLLKINFKKKKMKKKEKMNFSREFLLSNESK